MLLFVVLLLVLATSAFEVKNLRCEYLINPVGIDSLQPRFTWELNSADQRMLQQLSYRVVVHELSSDNEPPTVRTALWDTLHVTSSSSYNVKYSGPSLRSGVKYTWTVEVSASSEHKPNGIISSKSVSPTATFSMGMLSKEDWKGQFISLGKAGECPWFRTKFSLSEPEVAAIRSGAASAQLMVASVGYCEATVNGKAVTEGVLLPSISYLPKRVMYRSYDVSALLTSGDNAIGLWASQGWYSWAKYSDMKHFANAPYVMAELHVNGVARRL